MVFGDNKGDKDVKHAPVASDEVDNISLHSRASRRLYRAGSLASHYSEDGIVLQSIRAGNGREPLGSTASRRSRTPSGKSIKSRTASRAEYHQDLKIEMTTGYTKNLLWACFLIMFGSSFLFGYNIGVLNQPVTLIRDFYNETYTARNGEPPSESWLTFLWSLTTTLYLPGGMIGAFAAGFLADKIGRKRAILFSHLFAFAGAVISCCCLVAKAPEMLMFGRFMTGINCGFATQLAPMYLAEIAPFSVRGGIGTGHQLFITIGIFVGSVLGLREILGTRQLWPYLLLFNAFPALFSLILLPFVPESPRYTMLNRNNRKGAEKALRWYRQRLDVMADIEEMETESQESQRDAEEEYTMKQLLTTKQLHMPLLVACMLQVIQQLSGINAVFFYSTGIYGKAGVSEPSIQYAVIGTNAVNVIMTIIAVPVMDKAGRRPLLLYPMICMVFTLAIITMSLNLQVKYLWMGYISIICVIVYVICFAVGLGPIPVMIGAELFRQGPRPRAMSLAGLCNWFFTILVAISFESVQELAKEFTFVIFLVLMVLFTVFVFFKVPETKNKTFEEIASQYKPGADIEVEEIVDEDDVFDDQVGVNSHLFSEKDRMRNGSATSVDSKRSGDDVRFSLPEEKRALTKSEQNLQNPDV